MIHPDTELRFISAEIGYGVFATRPIPCGTLIWTQCHFDRVITRDEAAALPAQYQEVLGKYAYIDLAANYVLCWDAGRYVNHSCDPAMLGVDSGFEIAVRDLAPGDELTCEYGSLNLTSTLHCRCKSRLCRGTISAADTRDHWPAWDARVATALRDAGNVPQPLLAFALQPELFTSCASGLRQPPSFREQYALLQAGNDEDVATTQPWAMRRQVRV
jgi:hypothetical protein